jgi:hypothetical protein
MADLPDVHFGRVGEKPVDWRAGIEEDDEEGVTPPDVVAMLGFDPAKQDGDE